jgi:hypothetical protein
MDRSDHDSGDMLERTAEVVPEPRPAQAAIPPVTQPDLKAERAQRLAATLRQNLRRRKLSKTGTRPVDERN